LGSILEKMRSGQDSTFTQVVMALIIVAFVSLYIQPGGDRSSVVAEVNGEKILDTTYSRRYREVARMYEAQARRTLSDAEQREIGELVKQDLIDGTVLLQEARRLGVEVSDSEVARELLQLEFLRGPDGLFDEVLYDKYLKRAGTNRADFEEELRDKLVRAKVQQLVYLGASLSEPAIREAYVDSQTRVDLTVVRIRTAAFEDDVQVTDEERAKWLAENEAAVREAYDRDFERLYNHPEQVRLRLIQLAILPDGPPLADLVPRLNGLRDQIASGADMAELAKRWSEDASAKKGGDLGLRDVALLSEEMVKGTKDLKAGELSRVLTGPSHALFYRVEERVPARVDPLETVRDSIAERLIRAERVPALAAAFAEDQLLAKWRETGAVPQDLLDAQGLVARPTGPIPMQSSGPMSPPQAMLDAARTAEVDSVLPEVYEEGGVLFVAQLTARTEPDLSDFEADKGQIREQMLVQRRNEFFESWLAVLKSRSTIQ
jgi:peptidyl-prolyl cis-trans isomerase D